MEAMRTQTRLLARLPDYTSGTDASFELGKVYDPLKITIPVPSGIRDQQALQIWRIHNGSPEQMSPDIPGSGTECYAVSDGTITIEATQFSNYYIVNGDSPRVYFIFNGSPKDGIPILLKDRWTEGNRYYGSTVPDGSIGFAGDGDYIIEVDYTDQSGMSSRYEGFITLTPEFRGPFELRTSVYVNGTSTLVSEARVTSPMEIAEITVTDLPTDNVRTDIGSQVNTIVKHFEVQAGILQSGLLVFNCNAQSVTNPIVFSYATNGGYLELREETKEGVENTFFRSDDNIVITVKENIDCFVIAEGRGAPVETVKMTFHINGKPEPGIEVTLTNGTGTLKETTYNDGTVKFVANGQYDISTKFIDSNGLLLSNYRGIVQLPADSQNPIEVMTYVEVDSLRVPVGDAYVTVPMEVDTMKVEFVSDTFPEDVKVVGDYLVGKKEMALFSAVTYSNTNKVTSLDGNLTFVYTVPKDMSVKEPLVAFYDDDQNVVVSFDRADVSGIPETFTFSQDASGDKLTITTKNTNGVFIIADGQVTPDPGPNPDPDPPAPVERTSVSASMEDRQLRITVDPETKRQYRVTDSAGTAVTSWRDSHSGQSFDFELLPPGKEYRVVSVLKSSPSGTERVDAVIQAPIDPEVVVSSVGIDAVSLEVQDGVRYRLSTEGNDGDWTSQPSWSGLSPSAAYYAYAEAQAGNLSLTTGPVLVKPGMDVSGTVKHGQTHLTIAIPGGWKLSASGATVRGNVVGPVGPGTVAITVTPPACEGFSMDVIVPDIPADAPDNASVIAFDTQQGVRYRLTDGTGADASGGWIEGGERISLDVDPESGYFLSMFIGMGGIEVTFDTIEIKRPSAAADFKPR